MRNEFEKTFKQHKAALTAELTKLGKQSQVQLAEWEVEQNESDYEFYFTAGWQAAKAQAIPEGFVLVKKELPEQIAEKMAIDRIDKPRHENDPVWREIAEQSYKDQVKSKKWEFWRDYKAMIEAQEDKG